MLFGEHCTRVIQTPWGEYAWRADDLKQALDEVNTVSGVILGGDILTSSLEHTGNSWFYQPQRKKGVPFNTMLNDNIQESIHHANEYICQYRTQYGKDFMFVLVVQPALDACLKARAM